MSPLAYELGETLLARHKRICSSFPGEPEGVSQEMIRQSTLSYKELCEVVGIPGSMARSIGKYLAELAEWCQGRNLPPINALAVNSHLHVPGPGYFLAAGCGDWEKEVRNCIACKKYPATFESEA